MKRANNSPPPPRLLKGAAQRGGAILLRFCGSADPFLSRSKMSLFYLKTCTPVKAPKRPDFPGPISSRFSLKVWGLSPDLCAPVFTK